MIVSIARYKHRARESTHLQTNHKPNPKVKVTKPTTVPRSRNLRLISTSDKLSRDAPSPPLW